MTMKIEDLRELHGFPIDHDLTNFAKIVIEECITTIRELRLRTEMGGGVPAGYDEDSYMLGTADAIAEIEERFGLYE